MDKVHAASDSERYVSSSEPVQFIPRKPREKEEYVGLCVYILQSQL
jgi:hypothetical protein